MNILLIETDRQNVDQIDELIGEIPGILPKVTKCYTLEEGLTIFHQQSFDVVLLDLNLPDSNGLETITKACEEIKDIPVIAFTENHDHSIGIEAMSIGAQDYQIIGETTAQQLQDSIQYSISRKHAEEQMRTNQNLLLTIFNEAPITLYLLDKNKHIIKVNNSGLDFAKKSEKEIVGQKSGEFLHCVNAAKNAQGCGMGELCENCLLRQNIERTLKNKKGSSNIETVLPYKKNGTIENRNIVFSTSYIETPFEPFVQISINDITNLKRTQIQIEKSNKRLEALLKISQFSSDKLTDLFDFALDVTLDLTDSKLGFIYLYDEKNVVFQLDYTKKNSKELSAYNLPKTFKAFESHLLADTARKQVPVIANTPESDESDFSEMKTLILPLVKSKKTVAIAGLMGKVQIYDQTDLKQITLIMDMVWNMVEQKRHNEELVKAKERAEESDRLKSAFLSTMSHELRTPLNSVIGFSDLIEEEDDLALIKEFARNINDSGNHLLQIIEEIFSISELESADVNIHKELFTVADLFKSIDVEANKFESIRKHDLEVKLELSDHLKDHYLEADKSKIKQIFFHLISNATKFTNRGKITYGITFVNNTPSFFVRDTGIGISTENKEKIFDRFVQIEQAITREYEGIGLGLSICKRLIDLFRGKIWFDSELGKGTTFYFTFPELIIQILNPVDLKNLN